MLTKKERTLLRHIVKGFHESSGLPYVSADPMSEHWDALDRLAAHGFASKFQLSPGSSTAVFMATGKGLQAIRGSHA